MDLGVRPTCIPVSVLPLNLLCDFEANHVNQCLLQNGDIIVILYRRTVVGIIWDKACGIFPTKFIKVG